MALRTIRLNVENICVSQKVNHGKMCVSNDKTEK